jgi:hypothetical protein
MKRRIPLAVGVFLPVPLLLVVVSSATFALSPWRGDFRQPPLYIIEGYLDRSPKDAEIRDQIDIIARGRRHTLLVTYYGMPGEIGLDRYLSRVMAQPFAIRGTSEDVDRLANAPAGTKIAGTFAAYAGGSPSLLIADLTAPAPSS